MIKPRLASIYIYERMNKIHVDASFKQEEFEDAVGKIIIHFSLPKEDSREIEEIEELAIAKAEKVLKKTLGLME